MTNYERIKSMTVEEMAWELLDFRLDAFGQSQGHESVLPNTQKSICEWLMKEAENG